MTKPAPLSRTPIVAKFHKKGLWALLFVLIGAIFLDILFARHLQFAKGVAAGATLAYLIQSIFTIVAHRTRYHNKGRARAASQMMNDMYLAVLAKWGLGIVGFAFIFIALKGVVLWAVLAGFVLMQVLITLLLYRLGKQI